MIDAAKAMPMIRRKFLMLSAAAAMVVTALAVPGVQAQAQTKPEVDLNALMQPGALPDNVTGNADAPVTIVEYSSMTCPHCAAFHKEVLPELKKKYIETGKVKYIVREFPLDNVAVTAAMLARCVEPAKYLDFVDLLYQRQEAWAFKDEPLPELAKFAKQVGFTEERFNQCIGDQKTLEHINAVRDKASKEFKVRATPSFFVNGVRVKGAATIQKFDELIAAGAKS